MENKEEATVWNYDFYNVLILLNPIKRCHCEERSNLLIPAESLFSLSKKLKICVQSKFCCSLAYSFVPRKDSLFLSQKPCKRLVYKAFSLKNALKLSGYGRIKQFTAQAIRLSIIVESLKIRFEFFGRIVRENTFYEVPLTHRDKLKYSERY